MRRSARAPTAQPSLLLSLRYEHQGDIPKASRADILQEMFIRYLAEKSLDMVKAERKPRRNIQYKDVGKSSGSY